MKTVDSAKGRKAQRSQLRMARAPGPRAGRYLGPSSSAPPPLICNRVADCDWKSGGSGCECEKWPQWIAENKNTKRVQKVEKFNGNTAIDPEANDIAAKPGAQVSYYRPSGSKGFYYYNGKIESVYRVLFPSGQRKVVVALN